MITGITDSSTFPTTSGAYQTTMKGEFDGFITKLNTDGTNVVWSTFLGGNGPDGIWSIKVDHNDKVYVTGATASLDFPTTAGAFCDTMEAEVDLIVCRLSDNGQSLEMSTQLGGNDFKLGQGVAFDGDGNVYVTGMTELNYTNSTNGTIGFPLTPWAYQNGSGGWTDAFLCKFNPSGTSLLYSSFLGGWDDDEGYDMDVDEDGAAYVVGLTYSDNFPNTTRAYQRTLKGAITSCFVTKFNANGSTLAYSTFLGGSYDQEAYAMHLNDHGNVTLVGYTYSDDFPTTAGVYQGTLNGDDIDAFITMLSADGTYIVRSTLLGGTWEESGTDVTYDTDGYVIVGGATGSDNFPVTPGAAQTRSKEYDAFLTKLSPDFKDLEYSTYLGGSNYEDFCFVGAVGTTFAYAAGYTDSSDFPTIVGSYQRSNNGGEDGFVSKVTFDLVKPVSVAGDDVYIDQHESVQFNGSLSTDNVRVVNWTWKFTYSGTDHTYHGTTFSFTFDEAGVYIVTLTVTDSAGHRGSDSLNVTVRDITSPTCDAGPNRYTTQHETLFISGTASDNVAITNWTWTFMYRGNLETLSGRTPFFTFDDAGDYNLTLTVFDEAGNNASDWMIAHVRDIEDPTVDAGVDVVVDQHETVQLNSSGSSDNVGITNWTWTFVYLGQPVTLYGPVQEFTFDLAGNYEVSLMVEDEVGNRGMDTLEIVVQDTEAPSVDAGPDLILDQGDTINLDGTESLDNVRIRSYQWSFNYDGIPVTLDGATPQFYFGVVGVYDITLTVTDLMENSATDTMTVTVRDVTDPLVVSGADITVDQGVDVHLDGSESSDNVGIVGWTWSFTNEGTPVSLDGVTTSYVFEVAGVYIILLEVVDGAGNTASDTLVVTVSDITPPIPIAGEDQTVDMSDTVSLDGSTSTDDVKIISYMWSFEEDGTPIELEGVTQLHVFNIPGVYDVNLTVTDLAGNAAVDTMVLTVLDTIMPTLKGTVDPAPEIKLGDSCTFDASGSWDNVGITSVTWTFKEDGKTVVLEGLVVDHVFEKAGEYKVTLNIEDAGGNVATKEFEVVVTSSLWLYLVVASAAIGLASVILFLRRGKKSDVPD
jgi:PKD repeat protein